MNILKTGLLLAVMTALMIGVGNLIGGSNGMIIGLALALITNVGAFWFSDKLAIAMAGAKPVDSSTMPELYDMLERLSARANIPLPKLYIADNPQPNAFATGRSPNNSAVVLNSGLLQHLSQSEVEGVVAHELAHIKNRDTLTMTIAAALAGAITNLVYFAMWFGGSRDEESPNPIALLLMVIVAPFAAMLIQMAISRSREYEADRVGAEIAGSPLGLANALAKLDVATAAIPAEVSPSQSHLYIANPLNSKKALSLFSTHPPIQERVRRLREMAGLIR